MNTSRRFARPFVSAAIALFAAARLAHAAPAIPNPSFETDTFVNPLGYVAGNKPITGWTANPTNRIGQNVVGDNTFFANNGIIPNGTRVAFIESHGFPSTLSTTVTGLVAGTSYRVQFRANAKVSTVNPVASIRLNGGAPVRFTVMPVNGVGVFTNPYLTINAIFTATGTTALMEIANSTTDNSALLVDDFKITAATNITVTNSNDSGAGSLRKALADAAASPAFNVITFAPALSGQTIALASEIVVNDSGGVIIDASSLPSGFTIDGGAGTNRIFSVTAETLLSLRRLTLTGGNGTGALGSGDGGAIRNLGTLSLTACTLFGNTAGRGGAIFNTAGQLTLTQCTLSNNSITGSEGGAIRNDDSGTVALTHCTISGNTSLSRGGGISNISAALTVTNTILAANTSPNEADIDNFNGTLTRVGANIVQVHVNSGGFTDNGPAAINANPQLSALANNGGPTRTMAIAYTSPARNATVGSAVTTDQRGLPVVGTPDIGAFEMQAGTFVLSATTYQTPEGSAVTITINRTLGFSGTASVRLFTTNGTAGAGDFTARPNTAAFDVIFFDGDSSKSVDISTVADFLPEGNETFFVSLGSPTPPAATLGSPSTATVTIVDAFQVTNTNDDGTGSLRQALANAKANPGADRIYFSPTLNGRTIILASEIVVNDSGGVTVDASNLGTGVTIDGGPGTNRIFSIASGSTLALNRLTLKGGDGIGAASSNDGGAIQNNGTVNLTNCTITGNNASRFGGGMHNQGTATLLGCTVSNNTNTNVSDGTTGGIDNDGGTLNLTRCTFSDNRQTSTDGSGGAIWNGGDGQTTVSHCTFTANSANLSTSGGGIRRSTGTVTVSNSIIAGNTGGSGATPDVNGAFTSGGNNLVGITDGSSGFTGAGDQTGTGAAPLNPFLGPLADNGGPTKTVALLANSPALNAAVGSTATTDQRGKPVVGTPDIGAFEAQTGGVFTLSQTGYFINEGGVVTVTITRAPGLSGPAKVRLTTTPGSASATDFTGRPNSAAADIDFAAGDATKTVQINTTPDMLVEPNETFTVSLSLPAPVAPGVTLGSPSTATVAIIDPSAGSIVADTMIPGIPVITTPAANAALNVEVGGTATITGTATDNKGISGVTASVNGGAAIPLTLASLGAPRTGFSGNLTGLVAGINNVTVTATDFAGSSTTSATRTFKVLRPLLVIVSGSGSVTPAGFTPKSFQEVGQSVTLTAAPGAGAMFSKWNILSGHTTGQLGILASALDKPTLSFIHREGLSLQAVFVPNPYPAFAAAGAAGTDYTGLIHADPGAPAGGTAPGLDTEGLLKITLMSTGAFSGVIKMGGTTLPAFAGSFDPNGTARFGTARSTTIAIVRPGKSSLIVGPLTIDLSPGRMKDAITGTITATDFQVSLIKAVSKVTADRAYYDGVTTIVPPAYLGALNATQAYTVIFGVKNNAPLADTDYPQGAGFGFLTVSKAGVVTLTSGMLADGTAVTGSFKLSSVNAFPLFIALYPSGTLTRGYLSGDVALDATNPLTDMRAAPSLAWLRPLDNTQQYYPAGWPDIINVDFGGVRYAATFSPAASIMRNPDGGDTDLIGDPLKAPDPVNGNANLSFSAGKLSGTIAKVVNITSANVVTKVPANDSSFSLNFNPATGAFSGKFVHELDAGVPNPMQTDFQGAVYQKGGNAGAYGFFLTRKPTPIDYQGESGSVIIIGIP